MADVSVTGDLEGYLRGMVDNLRRATTVEVGYEDGTAAARVAAINEFGADVLVPAHVDSGVTVPPHVLHVPARAFMRRTVAEHAGEWPELLGAALTAFGFDAKRALAVLGDRMTADLRSTIEATAPAPPPPGSGDRLFTDTDPLVRDATFEVK